MEKDNFQFKLVQKHIFETIDFILNSSVNPLYKSALENPNTKIKDLQITKDSLFFNNFGTYIGADINMHELWTTNKIYSLSIKEFKKLIVNKYSKILTDAQKKISKDYLFSELLIKYKTLTPIELKRLEQIIETKVLSK